MRKPFRFCVASGFLFCAKASGLPGTPCSDPNGLPCGDGAEGEGDDLGLLQARPTSPDAGNAPLKDWNAGEASFMPSFGGIVPGDPLYYSIPGKVKVEVPSNEPIPAEFDGRRAWPACANVISHIRDQSHCGSCWAVGSAGTFNDRYCIATGDNATIISADDPLANCNTTAGEGEMATCVNPHGGGCSGGQLEFAWEWYVQEGVVSGGGYHDIGYQGNPTNTCAPYPFPPCHSEKYQLESACNESQSTPANFSACPNVHFTRGYVKDKRKAQSWYKIPNRTAAIQWDIARYGSVSCQVMATCSMTNYTHGVYVPSGEVCGGHVMRIIGWGVEQGQDFWWVANSWGSQWGIGGFIKWIRGVDAQGIESGVVAGIFEE
mmetsp:Transcript_85638/g.250741  ORF Transcript_85638/g.250741 Transcript_85638/m.250741 type:complete len:376 (-) Transcript_85638:103-1230(-)